MTKKTQNKGISVFLIAVLISLVGAVIISFTLYHEYEQYAEQTGRTFQEVLDETNRLRNTLAIVERFVPEALLDTVFEGGIISMDYLEAIDSSVSDAGTRVIVFNNSGDLPLTDFEVSLNSTEIEPYYKPAMVFPLERGIVILQPSQTTEWYSTEGTIEIKAAQDSSIKIEA